jgi:uncharacterized protein YigE (DUF2233 family)
MRRTVSLTRTLVALAATAVPFASAPSVVGAQPAGAQNSSAGVAAPVWQPIVPGAERATLTVAGPSEVLLLRFDLEHFRAEVVVGKGSPPRPRTAADLRQGRGAVAAVNGGFFDEHVVPLGLRIAGGDQRFPLRPKADWGVLVLSGHRARIVHTREYAATQGSSLPTAGRATAAKAVGVPPAPAAATPPPTATPTSKASAPPAVPVDGAIQVGPRLVVEGKAVKLRTQVARRTAVALDREGRSLTLVLADAPVEANELAGRLAEIGFDAALFLDGGPSTQLSLALGDAHVDIAGVYPVPDLLAIFTRSGPHRAAPSPPASTPASTPSSTTGGRRP